MRIASEFGFTIALDDRVVDDPRECLLPWVDLVKVDLPAIPARELKKVVRTAPSSD